MRKPKYEVIGFDEQEFADLDRLVRATLLSPGKPATEYRLSRVTQDYDSLKRVDAEFVQANSTHSAICFQGRTAETFDIWVNPNRSPDSGFFRELLIHELCHGYIGVTKGHILQWRKFFARAMHHYDNLVSPVSLLAPERIAENFLFYTKKAKSEDDGRYQMRLMADQNSAYKDAVAEMPRVYDLFDRMTKKETT